MLQECRGIAVGIAELVALGVLGGLSRFFAPNSFMVPRRESR